MIKIKNSGELSRNNKGRIFIPPLFCFKREKKWAKYRQLQQPVDKHPQMGEDRETYLGKRLFELSLWENMWDAAVHSKTIRMSVEDKQQVALHLYEVSNVLLFKEHFPFYPKLGDLHMGKREYVESVDLTLSAATKESIISPYRNLLPQGHLLRQMGEDASIIDIKQDDSEDEDEGSHDEAVPEFISVESMGEILSRFYDGGKLFRRISVRDTDTFYRTLSESDEDDLMGPLWSDDDTNDV